MRKTRSKRSSIAISLFATLVSGTAFAGGWSNWATPTQIDVIGADSEASPAGLMIYGAFGNVGNCIQGDRIFIPASHAQFNTIMAAAVSANISGRKIRGWVSSCAPHLWYSYPGISYDFVSADGAVSFGN